MNSNIQNKLTDISIFSLFIHLFFMHLPPR